MFRIRWFALALVAVLAPVLSFSLSGCDGMACNDRQYFCALSLDLSNIDWEPGEYTFETQADGETYTCTASLPDPDGRSWECSSFLMERNFRDDGPFPAQLDVFSTPSRATFRVLYEGQEIANETFKPRYKETEPNGDRCGICKNATVSMEF